MKTEEPSETYCRLLGGQFLPVVYQQWKQAQQRQRELVIQGTISAIENGSIDPVKGTAVLQKMGIQMPDGAGFGPGPEVRRSNCAESKNRSGWKGDLTAADEFAATEIARRFSEKNMGKMDKIGGNVAAPTDITASPSITRCVPSICTAKAAGRRLMQPRIAISNWLRNSERLMRLLEEAGRKQSGH